MKIVVCIKQVPGTNEVRLDPVTNTIIRDSRQSVINPFDSYAIEAAVQIKESLGGEVISLSMGIPSTERLLLDAVSRGADGGMLLSDRAFAGADTLATSYTLAKGVEKIGGVDLILCGKMAVDGDTAQIGPELAEHLGISHVTDVADFIEVNERFVIVKKLVEEGYQILKVALPALICVVKDINTPRMPSISGIRHSLNTKITILGAKELGADTGKIGLSGSPTQVVKTYTPERRGNAAELEGSPREKAAAILAIVKEVR